MRGDSSRSAANTDSLTARCSRQRVSRPARQAVIADAEPPDKVEVYRQLGLGLTYKPEQRTMAAEVNIGGHPWGYGRCPEGEWTRNPTLTYRADLQLRRSQRCERGLA